MHDNAHVYHGATLKRLVADGWFKPEQKEETVKALRGISKRPLDHQYSLSSQFIARVISALPDSATRQHEMKTFEEREAERLGVSVEDVHEYLDEMGF